MINNYHNSSSLNIKTHVVTMVFKCVIQNDYYYYCYYYHYCYLGSWLSLILLLSLSSLFIIISLLLSIGYHFINNNGYHYSYYPWPKHVPHLIKTSLDAAAAPGIDEMDNELATMTIRPNNDVVSSLGTGDGENPWEKPQWLGNFPWKLPIIMIYLF